MVVLRGLAAMSAVALFSAMVLGCGAGLSKEEADLRCDQEKAALSSFFPDSAYASCEACFEKCGDDCVRLATSPISYSCDTGSTSSSSSSSSSTTSSGQ
jgi:Na+-translocating ferredoxin:NAD+ oxidoreductase RNF subunit RnfB